MLRSCVSICTFAPVKPVNLSTKLVLAVERLAHAPLLNVLRLLALVDHLELGSSSGVSICTIVPVKQVN
jgi:hypothetical protein